MTIEVQKLELIHILLQKQEKSLLKKLKTVFCIYNFQAINLYLITHFFIRIDIRSSN